MKEKTLPLTERFSNTTIILSVKKPKYSLHHLQMDDLDHRSIARLFLDLPLLITNDKG